MPRFDNKNSMPTIFPFSFHDSLISITGDIGGRDIIKSNLSYVRYFEVSDNHIIQDIDTIEDFEKYGKIL